MPQTAFSRGDVSPSLGNSHVKVYEKYYAVEKTMKKREEILRKNERLILEKGSTT